MIKPIGQSEFRQKMFRRCTDLFRPFRAQLEYFGASSGALPRALLSVSRRVAVLTSELWEGINGGLRAGIGSGLPVGIESGSRAGFGSGLPIGMEGGLRVGIENGLRAEMESGLPVSVERGLRIGIESGLRAGIQNGLRTGIRSGLRAGIKSFRSAWGEAVSIGGEALS